MKGQEHQSHPQSAQETDAGKKQECTSVTFINKPSQPAEKKSSAPTE
jgi:hypothetical protein